MRFNRIIRTLAVSACAAALAIGFSGCGGEKPASSSGAGGSGEKITLVVGTSGLGARWAETTETGGTQGLRGFAIDMWNEIAKRNGWDIKYHQADFAGLWGMMDNDQIDTIAGNISMTPPRMEKYYFSEPFYLDNSAVIYKPEKGEMKDLSFLNGKKVSVGGTVSSRLVLDEWIKRDNLQIEEINLDTQADVVPNVLSDLSDAGVTDKSVAYLAIHELNVNLKVFDPKYRAMGSAAPFKKTERGKMLEEKVSKTIMDMKKDGTLKKMTSEWIYDDLSGMPPEFWKHWVQSTEAK